MTKVRTHTRVGVNGKRQTVKSHSRKLRPSRARANVRRAGQHRRRGNYGPAVACASIAAAEIGGWIVLRGAGVALVTVGLATLGAGVAARRATPSTPKPAQRSSGTVRPKVNRLIGDPNSKLVVSNQSARPDGPDRRTPSGFRQRQYNRGTSQERAEQDEFYRLRDVEGYKGPIQWNKGEMPRKVDSLYPDEDEGE